MPSMRWFIVGPSLGGSNNTQVPFVLSRTIATTTTAYSRWTRSQIGRQARACAEIPYFRSHADGRQDRRRPYFAFAAKIAKKSENIISTQTKRYALIEHDTESPVDTAPTPQPLPQSSRTPRMRHALRLSQARELTCGRRCGLSRRRTRGARTRARTSGCA